MNRQAIEHTSKNIIGREVEASSAPTLRLERGKGMASAAFLHSRSLQVLRGVQVRWRLDARGRSGLMVLRHLRGGDFFWDEAPSQLGGQSGLIIALYLGRSQGDIRHKGIASGSQALSLGGSYAQELGSGNG